MPRANRFAVGLARGTPQIGLWLNLSDPAAVEIAASSGFDWVLVDNEHAPRALDVTAELVAQRRQQSVREVVAAARAEAREQCRREHGHRHAGVDGRADGPPAFAGIRYFAQEAVERRIALERVGREVE